jgi:RNA polymerase sigma-70 factor (ECF subfamily)
VTARTELVRLLAATGDEDRACFAQLYRLTSAKLFGICLRICEDRQAAEDVLQEVYTTVWKRAGAFDPGRASPVTWLAAIARNRAIDWRRSRGSMAWTSADAIDELADEKPSVREAMLADEAERELLRCMEELEPDANSAIRQAFFGGLTYAELAERRGVPLGTMKSWIRRGLLRLKGCLDDGA